LRGQLSSAFAAEEIHAGRNTTPRCASLSWRISEKAVLQGDLARREKGRHRAEGVGSLDQDRRIEIEQCVTEPGLDGKPLVIARFQL